MHSAFAGWANAASYCNGMSSIAAKIHGGLETAARMRIGTAIDMRSFVDNLRTGAISQALALADSKLLNIIANPTLYQQIAALSTFRI